MQKASSSKFDNQEFHVCGNQRLKIEEGIQKQVDKKK